MKKIVFLIMFLIMPCIARGIQVETEAIQGMYKWQVTADAITARYGPLGIDVNYTVVDAISDDNSISITIPDDWHGIEFAFVILDGNENDTDILELYAGIDVNVTAGLASTSGGGFYIPITSLTILQGTAMCKSGYYFADSVTDSNNVWYASQTVNMAPVNDIGRFAMQTFGAKKIKIVASTLYDSDKIYVWYRRY